MNYKHFHIQYCILFSHSGPNFIIWYMTNQTFPKRLVKSSCTFMYYNGAVIFRYSYSDDSNHIKRYLRKNRTNGCLFSYFYFIITLFICLQRLKSIYIFIWFPLIISCYCSSVPSFSIPVFFYPFPFVSFVVCKMIFFVIWIIDDILFFTPTTSWIVCTIHDFVNEFPIKSQYIFSVNKLFVTNSI